MDLAQITFGPVASRRFGSSLGINNIQPKVCTYSCIYCQVGRTLRLTYRRRRFFTPAEIRTQIDRRLEILARQGVKVDCLTLVPDGEPTLDSRLGETIEALRELGRKIAVITNGSLLWRPEVRQAISGADLVSVKVDSVDPRIWRRLNRPHRRLRLAEVLKGVEAFAKGFQGELLTETMLVASLNDQPESIRAVAGFLAGIGPARACLAVPFRPPAEKFGVAPAESTLTAAYRIFKEQLSRVEFLRDFSESCTVAGADLAGELLGILAVHPLRLQTVDRLLKGRGNGRQVLNELLRDQKVVITEFGGHRFLVRKS